MPEYGMMPCGCMKCPMSMENSEYMGDPMSMGDPMGFGGFDGFGRRHFFHHHIHHHFFHHFPFGFGTFGSPFGF